MEIKCKIIFFWLKRKEEIEYKEKKENDQEKKRKKMIKKRKEIEGNREYLISHFVFAKIHWS